MSKQLTHIGSSVMVDIIGHAQAVPAKVDTGADRSAIWASDVRVAKDGTLSFVLFGPSSKFYTGEVIERKAFKVASVKSSSGHVQIRYRVEIPIKINGRRIRVVFSLAERGQHQFPILIGKRTLQNKFIVNVSDQLPRRKPATNSQSLNKELQKDRYAFYLKYHSSKVKK